MRFNEIKAGDVLLANDNMTVILFVSVDDISEDGGVKYANYVNLATGRVGVMTLDDVVINAKSNSLILLRGDQVLT